MRLITLTSGSRLLFPRLPLNLGMPLVLRAPGFDIPLFLAVHHRRPVGDVVSSQPEAQHRVLCFGYQITLAKQEIASRELVRVAVSAAHWDVERFGIRQAEVHRYLSREVAIASRSIEPFLCRDID